MNNITVIGNVGRDPELRYANSGTAVLKFSVADTIGKDDNTVVAAIEFQAVGKAAGANAAADHFGNLGQCHRVLQMQNAPLQ